MRTTVLAKIYLTEGPAKHGIYAIENCNAIMLVIDYQLCIEYMVYSKYIYHTYMYSLNLYIYIFTSYETLSFKKNMHKILVLMITVLWKQGNPFKYCVVISLEIA